MRLEKVVERYAPLIAAYQPKPTTAPAVPTTKARTPGRARSEPGTARTARSAIAGSTPTPIANAPPAQLPYSTIRPFQSVVAVCHSVDRWPRNAARTNVAPTARTTAPTRSHVVHVARQRRIHSERQPSASSPAPSAPKSAASCERVATATTHAPNASASDQRPGASIARTVSQRATVAAGYAQGSSTRIGAYESAGAAIAATAAKYAHGTDRTRRARR